MQDYINMLHLEGHEEGGYFTVFYKSSDEIIPLSERYNSSHSEKHAQLEKPIKRYASSSIYFLLEKKDFSAWHRLKSDEIWHYYDGSPIDIYVIDNNGELKTYTLGNPGIIENASFQVVIRAGVWFAADVRNKSSFSLAGCTVSPAFEYEDFELANNRDQLIKLNPQLTNIIDKFMKQSSTVLDERNHIHISNNKNQLSAQYYIEKFKMQKHKEGGYFSINYKSPDIVVPLDPRYINQEEKNNKIQNNSNEQQRFASSSIYFLLDKDDFSAWHQLKSDEIWHYYDGGSPIDIHTIDQTGCIKTFTLGNPVITENASFQVVIKAGVWFAADVRDKTSFGLVGCSVSPAFEYDDFKLADRKHLVSKYPMHETIIKKFTRISSSQTNSWTNKAITYAGLLTSGIGFYSLIKGKDAIKNCINNMKFKIGI